MQESVSNKRKSGQRGINLIQHKKAKANLMNAGPLPRTTTPYPKVANVVTTYKIFPETETKKRNRENRRRKQTRSYRGTDTIKDHTLDLVSIARQLPAAKLDLSNFAALVCRMVGPSTALVFKSGNIVTVRSLSPAQGIWTCHAHSCLLKGMKQLYMPEGTDFSDWYVGCGYLPAIPIITTLAGRLRFDDCFRENIVGHGYLGCNIDLAEMLIRNPHVARYEPASFPGLQWKASVQDKDTGKWKVIKNLIFSSGMWLIIGALHMRVINEVFFRLRKVASLFQDMKPEVPKTQRNKYRLDLLWNKRFKPILNDGSGDIDIPHILKNEKNNNDPIAPVQTLTEQIQNITARINCEDKKLKEAEAIRRTKKRGPRNKRFSQINDPKIMQALKETEDEKGYTLLMKAVARGQYGNVELLLGSGEDPSEVTVNGLSALDLLDGKDQEVYQQIRVLLLQHLIPETDHEIAIG